MACFIAPAVGAVVTTVVRRGVEKRENAPGGRSGRSTAGRWSARLGLLNSMLWGGTIVLVLDHLWRGELVARPPFLTALETPGQLGPILREVGTLGVAMTAAVVVVWAVIVLVLERRARTAVLPETES